MPYHSGCTSIALGDIDAPRRIVIMHGYTGGTDEFTEVATNLAKRLHAYVSVPLLPGHGTTEEDLARYSFDDFYHAAIKHVREAANSGKQFALIGHSFGAHLALLAGAQFPPSAAILTVMPYRLRPPFSIPGMELFARTKAFWDKPLSEKEKGERSQFFFYKRMPGASLSILKEANRRVAEILPKLHFPILTISNREDPLSFSEGNEEVIREGSHSHNKSVVLDRKEHGLFYGEGHEEVIKQIGDFLEREMM